MLSAQANNASRPRQLRKSGMVAENQLWYVLRAKQLAGHKFVRQHRVGPFIVDFVCREKALAIELDGGQHATSAADAERTGFLNGEGYSVLRFWNNEVLENRDAVLGAILLVLNRETPSPDLRFAPATLSPTGRGKRGVRASAASKRANESKPMKTPTTETTQ